MSLHTCRQRGEWLVVSFETDRLTDPIALGRVESALMATLEAVPRGSKVVVCLEGLDYVSSQLVGILLGARKVVASRGGRFVLCRVEEHLAEMLRVTRLERHFEISARLRDVLGKDAPRDGFKRRALVAASTAPEFGNADPEWID